MNKYSMGSASGPLSSRSDRLSGESLPSVSKSALVSSSTLKREADIETCNRPSTSKGVAFTLSPASILGAQTSPTPALPHHLPDRLVEKNDISIPASKSSFEGLPTTTAICGPAILKVGTRLGT